MKVYRRTILPINFKANGIAAGIKRAGKLDLALFYSEIPAKASCLFTTNKIQSAAIQVNQKYLKKNKKFQAIIVNSGNANCFTGNAGLKDAKAVAKSLAQTLKIKPQAALVNSTGIIGKRLPLLKIKKAIPELVRGLSKQGIDKAKKAIMTTDTFSKEITLKFNLGGCEITLCGVAKGAGMIAPNLACPERSRGATMLAFIFSDANITQKALKSALRKAVEKSFNCITVDGCMSTNDSVMMLANSAARNILIDKDIGFEAFDKALNFVCLELAKMVIRDAEGATKFIQIKVKAAKNFSQAKKVALAIANSNLFKTAMYGQNPNFGRIVAAVGASGVNVKEEGLKIKVSPLNKRNINVEVSVSSGSSSATVYTSDLTPEYIKINAEYN